MANWHWAAASCRGVSHIQSQTRLQDSFSVFVAGPDRRVFVAIVSDGAGSADFGGEGASLVCRTLSCRIREHYTHSEALPSDPVLRDWMGIARNRINLAATRRGRTPRDFAATLVLTVTDGAETLVAHVGDGCSVARDKKTGDWRALSWPAQGEYASTTFFVTDEPAPQMRIERISGAVDAVASFSDGIERLALDYSGRCAHPPFFRGIIRPLETEVSDDRSVLSAKLRAYLDSAPVNSRTDDDKTLILAVRRT